VFTEFETGAAYETVTWFPALMVPARNSWIVLAVGRVMLETVTGVDPCVTVNAAASEIVVERSSLKLRVSVLPSAAKVGSVTVLSLGPVLSTVERFVTAWGEKDEVLFPASSCTAESAVESLTPGEV
jgi:hypothetical protein